MYIIYKCNYSTLFTFTHTHTFLFIFVLFIIITLYHTTKLNAHIIMRSYIKNICIIILLFFIHLFFYTHFILIYSNTTTLHTHNHKSKSCLIVYSQKKNNNNNEKKKFIDETVYNCKHFNNLKWHRFIARYLNINFSNMRSMRYDTK